MERKVIVSVGKEGYMCNGTEVPLVLYGRQSWALDKQVWKKVDVIEIKCFRTIYGIGRVT